MKNCDGYPSHKPNVWGKLNVHVMTGLHRRWTMDPDCAPQMFNQQTKPEGTKSPTSKWNHNTKTAVNVVTTKHYIPQK